MIESAIWSASISLSRAKVLFGFSASAASSARACLTAASALSRAAVNAVGLALLKLLVELFLRLVNLGARRPHRGFVLSGLGSRILQTLLRLFARTLCQLRTGGAASSSWV